MEKNNKKIWAIRLPLLLAFITLQGCKEQGASDTTDYCQSKDMPFEAVEASPAALQTINRIAVTMGIKNDFKVIGGKFLKRTPIAAAFICGNVRHVIYDVEKYNWFDENVTDWQTLGVLTHELGHHAGNHMMVDNKPQKLQELEADYLAGFTTARLGATLKEAYSFTNILSEKGSKSHPPRADRRAIAIKGWKDAQEQQSWERKQCVRDDWSGESFPLYGDMCRVVNFCSGGKIAPRVACHKEGETWVIQG